MQHTFHPLIFELPALTVLPVTFSEHGLQTFSLHRWHSQIHQWGPEWHMLQFQRMSEVVDFNAWNSCVHTTGRAICRVRSA